MAPNWYLVTPIAWHDPKQHGTLCYCGRKAKVHISYGTGCANVCGIHARTISRRKGGFVKIDKSPQPPGEE